MAGTGRFGKYGDLKRKEQIRVTRGLGSGRGKPLLGAAKSVRKKGANPVKTGGSG
ncbi:MAG: hypothetical protein P4L55_08735 [Syntrophobacteraceae bacterium]|nr:hypothetical protein [Syntrophobacteraceae bacterium]